MRAKQCYFGALRKFVSCFRLSLPLCFTENACIVTTKAFRTWSTLRNENWSVSCFATVPAHLFTSVSQNFAQVLVPVNETPLPGSAQRAQRSLTSQHKDYLLETHAKDVITSLTPPNLQISKMSKRLSGFQSLGKNMYITNTS